MSLDSSPSEGDVVLLVGTMKGAFLFHSGAERRGWRMDGPHFRGEAVYALAFDQRGGRRRVLAGGQSMHWGSVVRCSDDFGATWTEPDRQNVRFPEDSGLALANIWQIRPGRETEPDVVYAGVEPAALFRSADAGETWDPVAGLLNHEHGVRAEFLPDKYPEFGQCVHKVVNHPSRPERLYLQNHWGLYRSDDWGDTWHDIANGVPSDFGFAMEVHPREPDTVYIIPLDSDQFRIVPGARLRVYRTKDAGASWHPLTEGLPQQDAYECVLRDGMSTDGGDPAGLYFGTRGGKLYGSADGGDRWMQISDALPPITCVKAAVLRPAAA